MGRPMICAHLVLLAVGLTAPLGYAQTGAATDEPTPIA